MGSDPIAILAGHRGRLTWEKREVALQKSFQVLEHGKRGEGGYFFSGNLGSSSKSFVLVFDIYANVVSENKQTSMPTLLVKTNQTKTSFVPVASFPNILNHP